ncbi:hypothetical protein [Methylobacterium trifolii]|uniref:Uncharacterized protein n=1 Tax=Methylobacterium trifolii TaxID=1003092 RepID=A0ABQ4UAI5_9HYPH|nr:hypothetical protein [Methylobacterium trifolii]GJE62765.1 hypothetical protein MPOCJGCO_4901 [Methylobacterium trifolii]
MTNPQFRPERRKETPEERFQAWIATHAPQPDRRQPLRGPMTARERLKAEAWIFRILFLAATAASYCIGHRAGYW